MPTWKVGLVFNGTRQWVDVEAEDVHEAADRAPGAMVEKRQGYTYPAIDTNIVVVSAERRD